MEAREEGRKMADAFKLALISADPQRYMPMVFPSVAPTSGEITEADVMDTDAVEWVFTEEVNPADAEAELEALMAQAAATPMTLEDVEQHAAAQDPDW